MSAAYHQRAACAVDPTFQARCRMAAKEHAMAVAGESVTGSNWANRWRLAQALMTDGYSWLQVAELVVSDGVTVDGVASGQVADSDLAARVAAVFDGLAGAVDYHPVSPPAP